MEDRRILIPKELLEKSDLKKVEQIIVTLNDNGILLVPYQDDYKEFNVLGIRSLDKGRFSLPNNIRIPVKELVPVLYRGKIWIKRCVLWTHF